MSTDETRLARLEAQLEMVERYSMGAFFRSLDRAYETILLHRPIGCIVCGHADRRSGFDLHTDDCLFGGGRLERYICPRCDTIFGPMKYLDLDEEFVGADYELIYSRHSEADLTEVEEAAFFDLEPKRNGVYVNWGCGAWSKSVASLRQNGWNVWGYEPFAENSDPHVVSRLEAISFPVDGIFSNNVIEHFRTPVQDFLTFYRLLKPGGRMVHASPCYVLSYTYTRFHTFFPLGRSAQVLAARTGFRVAARGGVGQYLSVRFDRQG